MNKKHFLTLLLLGGGLLPAAGHSNNSLDLDTLVVTADRREKPLSEAIPRTTVVTREDIEASAALDVFELLRLQPGVDVARLGGRGQQTTVFLRGTNSNQVLVLIDGVRAASVHTGAYAWDHLPLAQIERIEIVRGPRASLYGSEAVGGVIQIFTRRGDTASARLAGGSFSTLAGEIALGFDSGALHGGLAAGHHDSDGFSAQNANGFSYDPDDDGYRNSSFSGSVGGELGSHHRWSARAFLSDGETEFDQGVSEARDQIIGGRLEGRLGDGWDHSVSLAYQDGELETPVFGSAFDSERLSLDWIHYFALADTHEAIAGLNYYDEDGVNSNSFTNTVTYQGSRHNLGLFGLWRSAVEQNTIEASLRYDDNSEFGGELTGALAWAYDVAEHTRISASFGTAFRAPTLSEQLSPGFGGLFAGNPSLDPETSESLEFSVRSAVDSPHWWSASLYATDIDDLIDFSGADFQAININKAEIRGLEATYGYASGPWSTQLDLTVQDTENLATGESLLRRPDHKLGGSIDYTWDNGARIAAEMFYSDERLDFGSSLDSYWLLNVSGRYPVTRQWTLEARIENLLDEDYELATGYNTPELSAFVGVRWRAKP